MAECANCGDPDASASLMGVWLCPKCYSRMAEKPKYDDVPEVE